jgi:hypothetical protein
MAAKKPNRNKKYFTPAEANASLPLVRAIVRDITELFRDLAERHERLTRALPSKKVVIGEAHREELLQVQEELERGKEQLKEYETELRNLGVELKDYQTGLIDFPCRMDGREVYLCWKLGEPDVSHWHEVDAGFAGRQKLMVDAGHS